MSSDPDDTRDHISQAVREGEKSEKVKAVAHKGYRFKKWTKDGDIYSDDIEIRAEAEKAEYIAWFEEDVEDTGEAQGTGSDPVSGVPAKTEGDDSADEEEDAQAQPDDDRKVPGGNAVEAGTETEAVENASDAAAGTAEEVLTALPANLSTEAGTVITYTVTFAANVPAGASTSCTGSMDDQSFAADEKKALSANGYSLPGYDFAGWNTKADGTGTAYSDEEPVGSLSDDGSTITLYAQWNAREYRVIFHGGDIGGEHVQKALFDQPGTLDTYSDSAFGWDSGSKALRGWVSTGFANFYRDGAGFLNLCGEPRPNGSLAEVNLVADWVQNGQIIVTIAKDGVPQEGLSDNIKLVNADETEFSLPISYKDGKYVFDTSQASQQGSTTPAPLPEGKYVISFGVNVSGSTTYPKVSATIDYEADSASSVVFNFYTLSLKNDPVQVKLRFGGEGSFGISSGSLVVPDGSTVTIRITYLDPEYMFDRYTADGVAPIWEDGDPTKAEQTIPIRGRTTITAHVVPKEYSVTVEGGTADVATAKAGDTVTITANEPEEGMSWVQWSMKDGIDFAQTDGFETTFTMPARDVTVHAVFKEITPSVLDDQVYTGEAFTPTFGLFGVTFDGVDAVFPNYYDLSYEDNVDAGTAKVTVTMKEPYAGTKTVTFRILPADISGATVEVPGQIYSGTELTPEPTVTWKGRKLVKDTDYTLSYDKNLHAGTAAVIVTGKGNFDANTTATGMFEIAQAAMTITGLPQTYTYNGQDQGEGDTVYEDPAELAGKVSAEGLRDGDLLASIVLDGQGNDAGKYEIAVNNASIVNAAGDNVAGDYDITYESGTLTIERAGATITVDSASKAEGGNDPSFTGSVEGLIADGDLGRITYYRTNNDETPGTYEKVITAKYTDNKNYDVAVKNGDFTIRNVYTLKWLDGDGSVLQENTYIEGEKAPVYEGKDPVKPATAQYTYKFSGWDKGTVDGKTTTYKPLFNGTVRQYNVTFVDYDGKTILKEAAAYDYGTAADKIVQPDEPTREADEQYAYTFAGWTPKIAVVTGNATYKATYRKTPVPAEKATLTFDLAGGTLAGRTGRITIEAGVGDTIKLPGAPERTGYTFKYWKGSQYKAGAEYTVTGDHTFTAEWEKTEEEGKTYTVTFDPNGHGRAPAAQTVEEGKKASRPKDPTADGYIFGGWFTDRECRKAFDFNAAITKDVTLYAKWTKKKSSESDGSSKKSTTRRSTAAGGTSGSGSKGAETGDENRTGLWLILATASLLGLILAAVKKKQSR